MKSGKQIIDKIQTTFKRQQFSKSKLSQKLTTIFVNQNNKRLFLNS